MDSASESDVGWALVTARATAVVLLVVIAVALYATATTRGLVSIVAILGSLHTSVTVVLAAIVLRERIGRVRWAGVVTAVAGAIAIATG